MGDWERVKAVFVLAADADPGDRIAVLDRECAGDAALRREVESLLDAGGGPRTGAGARAAAGLATSTLMVPLSEGAGMRIGPYKLLEQIGEGGFGVVFLAEQTEPLRRRVALKIIRLGMDSRQVVARFEQERQALALMDHPNIAKVLDAGATESGRPFFVMELVRGDPITRYCDTHNLSLPQRLELFEGVCHAVQHAHQKGIIHRDLKPSNVLVTVADGKPIPKVIDFGIAKATGSRLTEKTLFTEHRALIGTPEYMSPEQAETGGVDIDTRSDVYSLGVLLYELLTGTTPFDPRELRSAAFAEVQRIIREVDPPKPSTRLSGLPVQTASSSASAAGGAARPVSAGRLVRGDLDWIVMRCLEKDRARRYDTAAALAQDLRRHLEGRPVEAAPPGAAYRIRKFVRRRRATVFTVCAVTAAILIGLAAAAAALVQAREQAALARRQRDKAQWVARFLEETLTGVDRGVSRGRDATLLRELMDDAAARITSGELASAPGAERTLRRAIGRVYVQIAEFAAAESMLAPLVDAAMAADPDSDPRAQSEELAASLNEWAAYLLAVGRPAEAEPFFSRALEIRRGLFPGDHPDVAQSRCNLAVALMTLGRARDAEPHARLGAEMRERLFPGDHPDVATGLTTLADAWTALGRAADATPICRRALEMRRRLYATDHPALARSLHNLGYNLVERGDPAGAEPLYREALEMRERLFPGDHPDVALSLNNLAFVLRATGRAGEAAPLYARALDMRRRLFPGDHPDVAQGLNNLAGVMLDQGRDAEAEPLYREALEMRRRLFPGDHPDVAFSLSALASIWAATGRAAEAVDPARSAVEMSRRIRGGDHPDTARYLLTQGTVEEWLRRPDRAIAHYREALAMYQRLGPAGIAGAARTRDILRSLGADTETEPTSRGGDPPGGSR